MPELVDEGITGYLVDSPAGALEVLDSAATLDRRAIRRQAVARFGVDRMVAAYLDAYRMVLYGRMVEEAPLPSAG